MTNDKRIFIRMIDGGWRVYWPNRKNGGEYRDIHDYGGIKAYLLGQKPHSELIKVFQLDDDADTPLEGTRGALV